MNDDFLESFFAGCDEATMAELMSFFEAGDRKQLDDYLQNVSDEETKKQLIDGFAKLQQFKQTEAGDD